MEKFYRRLFQIPEGTFGTGEPCVYGYWIGRRFQIPEGTFGTMALERGAEVLLVFQIPEGTFGTQACPGRESC